MKHWPVNKPHPLSSSAKSDQVVGWNLKFINRNSQKNIFLKLYALTKFCVSRNT